VRSGLSVGQGVCEPQYESVKQIEPRKRNKRKPMYYHLQQAAMCNSIAREFTGSAGVRERGEYTKVVHVYLGGLTVPVFINIAR
jgi:hypothetical protein